MQYCVLDNHLQFGADRKGEYECGWRQALIVTDKLEAEVRSLLQKNVREKKKAIQQQQLLGLFPSFWTYSCRMGKIGFLVPISALELVREGRASRQN